MLGRRTSALILRTISSQQPQSPKLLKFYSYDVSLTRWKADMNAKDKIIDGLKLQNQQLMSNLVHARGLLGDLFNKRPINCQKEQEIKNHLNENNEYIKTVIAPQIREIESQMHPIEQSKELLIKELNDLYYQRSTKNEKIIRAKQDEVDTLDQALNQHTLELDSLKQLGRHSEEDQEREFRASSFNLR
jgi:hypothetical protein